MIWVNDKEYFQFTREEIITAILHGRTVFTVLDFAAYVDISVKPELLEWKR